MDIASIILSTTLFIPITIGIYFAIVFRLRPKWQSRRLCSEIVFSPERLTLRFLDTFMYTPVYKPMKIGFGGAGPDITDEEILANLISAETLHPVLRWRLGIGAASDAIDRSGLHSVMYGQVNHHGLIGDRLDFLIEVSEWKHRKAYNIA